MFRSRINSFKAWAKSCSQKMTEVILLGSGMVGCETAIDLAMDGKKVTMVELMPVLGQEILVSMRKTLLWKLDQLGVEARASTRAVGISEDGVKVITADGSEEFLPCDTVVLATGLRSDNSLYYKLVAEYPNVHLVGDCNTVGRFIHSGRAAYAVANSI